MEIKENKWSLKNMQDDTSQKSADIVPWEDDVQSNKSDIGLRKAAAHTILSESSSERTPSAPSFIN